METPRRKRKHLTPSELETHLAGLATASEEEIDELLTDLLCHSYADQEAQNS